MLCERIPLVLPHIKVKIERSNKHADFYFIILGMFLAIIVSLFMIFKTLLMSPVVWVILLLLVLFFRGKKK